MPRDDATIVDLIYHSRLMIELIEDFDRDRFLGDLRTQLAVARLFEILGEAAKRLSQDFRDQHPTIPWRQLAGMRDVLIHNYDRVDPDRVWEAAIKDIPMLLTTLEPLAPSPEQKEDPEP